MSAAFTLAGFLRARNRRQAMLKFGLESAGRGHCIYNTGNQRSRMVVFCSSSDCWCGQRSQPPRRYWQSLNEFGVQIFRISEVKSANICQNWRDSHRLRVCISQASIPVMDMLISTQMSVTTTWGCYTSSETHQSR